ncbi:hypothetical protein D9758_009509 [Tetrapyrgos nigripes]|uniref:Uncharacterized protein n=1 Tax=Tetrapyrgos nigripes TaxID=182062 RepID=A0A8H5LGE1_9AGAR|nr:hypothetical protein D9758_009509 [Tetrapyrgos nigripes]
MGFFFQVFKADCPVQFFRVKDLQTFQLRGFNDSTYNPSVIFHDGRSFAFPSPDRDPNLIKHPYRPGSSTATSRSEQRLFTAADLLSYLPDSSESESQSGGVRSAQDPHVWVSPQTGMICLGAEGPSLEVGSGSLRFDRVQLTKVSFPASDLIPQNNCNDCGLLNYILQNIASKTVLTVLSDSHFLYTSIPLNIATRRFNFALAPRLLSPIYLVAAGILAMVVSTCVLQMTGLMEWLWRMEESASQSLLTSASFALHFGQTAFHGKTGRIAPSFRITFASASDPRNPVLSTAKFLARYLTLRYSDNITRATFSYIRYLEFLTVSRIWTSGNGEEAKGFDPYSLDFTRSLGYAEVQIVHPEESRFETVVDDEGMCNLQASGIDVEYWH